MHWESIADFFSAVSQISSVQLVKGMRANFLEFHELKVAIQFLNTSDVPLSSKAMHYCIAKSQLSAECGVVVKSWNPVTRLKSNARECRWYQVGRSHEWRGVL